MNKLPFNLVKKDESNNIGYIDIEGIIGESFWGEKTVTKEDIKADLEKVKSAKMTKLIVNINSLGGDVNHALSIYDMLTELDCPVIGRLNGFVASAATIIAMACDQIEMSENAFFLVHKAMTITIGNANEIENDLNFLNKIDETITNIYSKRVDIARCQELLEVDNGNGKWLTADETLEYGFVDAITKRKDKEKKEEAVLNSVDAKRMGLPEFIGVPETPETKGFFQNLKDKILGTKEEKVEETIEETPTEEVIEETAQVVDDNDVVEEEKAEDVEEKVEEPVLSLYEETEIRIANLEKEINSMKDSYKMITDKFETISNINVKTEDMIKNLQTENDTLTKEKAVLLEEIKQLEDEPVVKPINLSPSGNQSQERELTLMEKRANAWDNISDAKNAYRKK